MINKSTITAIGLVFLLCVTIAGCGSGSGYASNIIPFPSNSNANTVGGSNRVAAGQTDNESATVLDTGTAVDLNSTPTTTAFAPTQGLYPSPTPSSNPSPAIPMALPAQAPAPTMPEQEEIVDGKTFPVSDIETDGGGTVAHGSACENVAIDLVVAQGDRSRIAARTRHMHAHKRGSHMLSIIGNCGLRAAKVKVLPERAQRRFNDVVNARVVVSADMRSAPSRLSKVSTRLRRLDGKANPCMIG